MASSVSTQDEPNPVLRFATLVGKLGLSPPPPLFRLHYVPKEYSVISHVITLLLTKIVRSRWLDIGLIPFLHVYGPQLCLCPWTCKQEFLQCIDIIVNSSQKKNLPNVQPSRSYLVLSQYTIKNCKWGQILQTFIANLLNTNFSCLIMF